MESNSFSFGNTGTGAMRTTFFETHKYKFGPITPTSFNKDPDANDEDLQMPPKFRV